MGDQRESGKPPEEIVKQQEPRPEAPEKKGLTIEEVKTGLARGLSYELHKIVNGAPCVVRVDPIGDDRFRHSVTGNSNDGWGGVNELLISELPGRFETDGWQQTTKSKPKET